MSKWSSKQILSFLEVYETYEVLWNIESHLYRDRTARDDAIKKLLCELNIEGLTVEDLRRKIKMIKTVYSAELNKIIKSQKNEERNAVVYTPKLSWFQKADSFLRNVTATKSPTTIVSTVTIYLFIFIYLPHMRYRENVLSKHESKGSRMYY